MTDSTAEFFHELDRRGHESLLEKATESVRFDLADGRRIDRWLVSLDRGEVTASHKNAADNARGRSLWAREDAATLVIDGLRARFGLA